LYICLALLTSGFHSCSLLMLSQLLNLYTVWMWAELAMRYMLLPTSGSTLKAEASCTYIMLSVLLMSIQYTDQELNQHFFALYSLLTSQGSFLVIWSTQTTIMAPELVTTCLKRAYPFSLFLGLKSSMKAETACVHRTSSVLELYIGVVVAKGKIFEV
jgi:hypothetical protein